MAASRVSTLDKEDPEYKLIYDAIDDLQNDNELIRSRGSDTLFDIMGIELLKDMGMEDNPAFSYKLREYKAREAALRQERLIRLQETSQAPDAPVMPGLGEESSGMPDRSIQEFTREEAESFMGANPDFRGQLRVDGQLMSNEGDGPARTAPEGLSSTGQDTLPDTLPDTPAEPQKEGYTPPSIGGTELNTPAVREAVANVPAEVKEAVESIIATGDEDEVEQAKQEIADEFGEAVAAILFDNVKSARGTGKSAVMDGLQ